MRCLRGEAAVSSRRKRGERQCDAAGGEEDEELAPHRSWHPKAVEERARVQLPPGVGDRYEVYVNGVRQEPGRDFDRLGDTLVFRRTLAHEGRLGPFRWLSMLLGIAGTYRKHESVDVVYESA